MPHNWELYEYRNRMLKRIRTATDEFCAACRAAVDPTQVIGDTTWNVHQLAVHVRDMDAQIYTARLQRTANEERPLFPNFDADEWHKVNYQADEPLEKVLSEFQASVRSTVDWLDGLPPAAWSRLSRHDVMGEFTLQAWAERGLAHIEEHLAVLQRQ